VRFLGFFLAVFAALWVLRQIPGLGRLFEVPLIGFYLAAVVVSVIIARAGSATLERRRSGAEAKRLGAVDTPHNQGKLGTLHLQAGRARKALPLLESAATGEPDEVEWQFRLGQAQLECGFPEDAVLALEKAVSIDEDHAYGGVLLTLALARKAAGDREGALETILRLERNNGPTPEGSFRKGQILKALKRRDEARAAFAEVTSLASSVPRYQRAEARQWVVRSFWAKW
jgi:hypothetical protein